MWGGGHASLSWRLLEAARGHQFRGLKVKIAPICVMTGAFFKGFSGKGKIKKNNNKKADLMINNHALPLTLKGIIVSAQRCKSS